MTAAQHTREQESSCFEFEQPVWSFSQFCHFCQSNGSAEPFRADPCDRFQKTGSPVPATGVSLQSTASPGKNWLTGHNAGGTADSLANARSLENLVETDKVRQEFSGDR